MIRNVIVNYKGIELICKGYHESEQNSFEIHCVCYGETEVTQLLDTLNFDWTELESLCVQELH